MKKIIGLLAIVLVLSSCTRHLNGIFYPTKQGAPGGEKLWKLGFKR